jgi:transposase-like protein
MNAHLVHDTVVKCPACASPDYRIYRREPAEDHALVYRCRCNNCGDTFRYKVDRTGRTIEE